MDKGRQATAPPTGAGAPAASAPMPSAPPSYEEAVGLSMGPASMGTVVMQAPTAVPPYPIAGAPMPMPAPYVAPTVQMPHPQQVSNQTQAPEVRVIHQHVTLTLGPSPIKMSCPSCHADIKTTTMSDHQPSAHVCCIVLCLLGCCLCSCLPYCLSAFLSVHHFCPNCKAYIGTWKG